MNEPKCVILFKSTSHVMRAERALGQVGVKCRLIPVPRELSSQCGICLRLDPPSLAPALAELAARDIEHEGSHTVTRF